MELCLLGTELSIWYEPSLLGDRRICPRVVEGRRLLLKGTVIVCCRKDVYDITKVNETKMALYKRKKSTENIDFRYLNELSNLSEAQASCRASAAASRALSLCLITSCK